MNTTLHEKSVIKIQRYARDYLIRKKRTGTFKSLNNEEVKDESHYQEKQFSLVQGSFHDKAPKTRIIIHNFEELISSENYESPNKEVNFDLGSDLASFRKYPDDPNHSPDSFNQDPAILMGPIPVSPISPIISIAPVQNNFTNQSINKLNPRAKINSIDIKPSDEDENEVEHPFDILSPHLKQLKFTQYTPSFPLKNEDPNIT